MSTFNSSIKKLPTTNANIVKMIEKRLSGTTIFTRDNDFRHVIIGINQCIDVQDVLSLVPALNFYPDFCGVVNITNGRQECRDIIALLENETVAA